MIKAVAAKTGDRKLATAEAIDAVIAGGIPLLGGAALANRDRQRGRNIVAGRPVARVAGQGRAAR
jgi:hypothetical protein